MERRTFLRLPAAAPFALATVNRLEVPRYRVVSSYEASPNPGMPGPYPGRVVSLKSGDCVDESTDKVNDAVVREMLRRGMETLTGESDVNAAWRRFFVPEDIVGIKVNCVGRPRVVSSPEVVREVVERLLAIGLKPSQIYLYERFLDHLNEVNYPAYLPEGVQYLGAEWVRGGLNLYDPKTYVEVNFFGEDDTRSNAIRLVTEQLTKIINIPNMKDHGAAGVTGCLKNIAYGSFSNVDRSHQGGRTHTYSMIGTLAAVEPVRSRTVLQIMDGLRGVWHGGPFCRDTKYMFYPKQFLIGTDPVAVDRLLLDIIDNERKKRGAISIWNRSDEHLRPGDAKARDQDPNVNPLIREPEHVQYAAGLGLGVYDLEKIRIHEIEL